jgi:thimet oligopeptidase
MQNVGLLEEMFALRKELAGLYGLPTYAHYGVRRKMVQKPEVVNKFLADVKAAVVELEKKDVEELRAEKAKDLGTPLADTRLQRWDVPYYQEKVKKARFSIDQEELRRYFPTDKAVAFTLRVCEALYGVKFSERKVASWHADVRYFDVADGRTGKYLSSFYLDLYPRDGKYSHAAAWPVRGVSRLTGRTPMSVLVTNFDRKGLDHREMETLMHEFGHVLHGVLSTADYNHHAGTATVNDFVEAPSQMLEEWVRREQPLALMKQVCPECPRLSSDQIARLESARRYGQGLFYARQWLYAAYDMALSQQPQRPLDLWKRMEGETPLGHVDGTMFPAAFGHIASNYAAGYYGYMWSQVIALDMLSAFKGNLLDPKVGARYRDAVLSQGGQAEAMDLVKAFLGREPSSEAFFREITGKR